MGVDYRQLYTPEQLEPFFPHEILRMVVVVLCTLAVLMILVVLPTLLSHLGLAGLHHSEDPADPGVTPPHIRPEWYFLAVYQYLKLMPSEILGMEGKALGIFSQAIVMAMIVLLPFWFPLRSARLEPHAWGKGLLIFVLMLGCFLISAVAVGLLRLRLPAATQDLVHPMYVWPLLGVGLYLVIGLTARARGFAASFRWLKLYSVAAALIAFQALTFLVVLGQGLAGVIPARGAYLIGGGLATLATGWILRFVVQHIRGRDGHRRVTLLIAFVTEGILLMLGLTIWALWPAGGLYSAEHGWHEETAGFLFSVLIIAIAAIVLLSFLLAERRVVRKVLRPEERDTLL